MNLKRSILIILLFISYSGYSALYKMSDTTIRDCSGTHTDTDALFGGLYSSNEDFTFTICPGFGATIYYTFSMLNLEIANDTIWFYDGSSTSAPLISFFVGNHPTPPPTITANSGCMTIRFKSDGSLQLPGWIATWTTLPPPVIPPILGISSLNPPTCDSNYFIIEFDKNVQCDSIVNSSLIFTGFNPPTVTSITKVSCSPDSSRFARVNLSSPFIYNCEYIMVMGIKIPNVCDSVYNFTLRDTFNFVNCNIDASIYQDSTVCYGGCASIGINPVSTCNNYSYSWNNGLPNTLGPHNVCPTVTTTYVVTITESTSGKTFTDSVTVTVLDTVNPSLNISTNTSNPPSCNSSSFILKFDRPLKCNLIDSGLFTITGLNGSIFSVTSVTPLNCTGNFLDSVLITYTPSFSYNCEYYIDFNLNYTDSCGGFVSIISKDTFLISNCIFALPVSYFDTICVGSCVNISTISPCSPVSFIWSNGLPNSSGPHIICPTNDTTFYLTATESSSGLVFKDTITITVVNATINSVSPICEYNSPFNLTANSTGGIWSGNGITNSALGTFDPSVAGGGIHNVIYNLANCSDTISITVNSVNAGGNRNRCASGIPINLNGASPAGGVWTGTYVNTAMGTFTPTIYGTFYSYYTVNGCVDSIRIIVDTIALPYKFDTLCSSSPIVTIPFTPTGGTWSGTGITSPSLGNFNPAIANNGSNKLQYLYKGCRDTVDINIIKVNSGNDTIICPSQAIFTLPPATPSSGIWSGIGITNINTGSYDPSIIGTNGIDTIVYNYSGCTDTLILELIQTNITPDTFYFCPSQDSVLLNTITGLSTNPSLGNWYGNGVKSYGSNHYVYPQTLGQGMHTVYYTKNTCIDSVVLVIYPSSLSYTDSTICSTHPPFKLDSINNMPGVIWSGTGIIDSLTGIFDPSLTTAGTTVITYKTINTGCYKYINMHVYNFVAASITIQDTLCYNNSLVNIPVIPTGGVWSGTGNFDKTTGQINTATAGGNSHQLIYTYGNGLCETSDTKTIFIRDSISINLSVLNDTICLGNSTNITAIGIGGNPSPNFLYSWSHTSNNNNTQTVSPITNQTYNVTVNDGCSDSSTKSIDVIVLSIIPNLIISPIVCFGEIGYTTFDTTQKSIYNFSWTNPVSTADTIFGIGNDTNQLRITNSFGCSIDTSLTILSYGILKADFSVSPNIYPKCLSSNSRKVIVTDKSTGASSGTWDFGDNTILPYSSSNTNETNTYTEGGNYIIQLVVKNLGPCFDTLDYNICVSDQLYFIPDAFSPNSDGMNDILYVRSSETKTMSFYIFDRWGKIVFESDDVNIGWDGNYKGESLEAGIYFYKLTLNLENGETIKEKGDITLKR